MIEAFFIPLSDKEISSQVWSKIIQQSPMRSLIVPILPIRGLTHVWTGFVHRSKVIF